MNSLFIYFNLYINTHPFYLSQKISVYTVYVNLTINSGLSINYFLSDLDNFQIESIAYFLLLHHYFH